MNPRPAAAALLVSAGALVAAPAPSLAAGRVPAGVVGQHATVMNNIARARQRDNAAIKHVQTNIRSTRPRTY